MDIKDSKWFLQVSISGQGEPFTESGSIFDCMRASMQYLNSAQAPRSTGGGKRIAIVMQQTPFTQEKFALDFELKVAEIAAALPTDTLDESQPQEGETAQTYFERLDSLGYDPATAMMLTNDWFSNAPTDELMEALRWIADPKATRFRKLNSSQEAYEAAMKNEYEDLRHYVLKVYPSQCERIVFRTAH